MLVNAYVRLKEVLSMHLSPGTQWRISHFEELVSGARGSHKGYEQRIFAHYIIEALSPQGEAFELRRGKVLVHFERSTSVEGIYGDKHACF